MLSLTIVALVGKVGHGKTMLLNKLTGKRFPSNMGARSCTRTLQFGYTPKNEILVVDTPGFYASEDIAAHIAAQKLALENRELSGIFVVVKYARADEMAETTTNLMGFFGSDDLRIIVTHDDVARVEQGYNPSETKLLLSERLDIAVDKILLVGKDSTGETVEAFIQSTLHHPREFQVSDEQIASISSLSVASRKYSKAIDEIYAKIAAASKACMDLTQHGRSYEADVGIGTVQHSTTNMVEKSKAKIFQDVMKLDNDQQRNLVYGKAGLSLTLRLKSFMDATNRLLSWDVADPQDPRNAYRKCPCCGAIFNKTEGCDGETTCGAVPTSTRRHRPQLIAEFRAREGGWIMQFFWDGTVVTFQYVLDQLRRVPALPCGGRTKHRKSPRATIESGCGSEINWSTMLPVDPELLKSLGVVELHQAGHLEQVSKGAFEKSLLQHEAANMRIYDKALSGKSA